MREPTRCIPASRLAAYERLEQACNGLDPETVERLLRIGRAVLVCEADDSFDRVLLDNRTYAVWATALLAHLLAAGDDDE